MCILDINQVHHSKPDKPEIAKLKNQITSKFQKIKLGQDRLALHYRIKLEN